MLGLALLAPGLALLVAGLTRLVVAFVPGVLLLVAFVVHALRAQEPLIDLRIFRDRVVAASAATTLLFGAAFFGSLLLLALSFSDRARPERARGGAGLGVQGLGAMFTMPVAGKLTDRSGAGPVVLAGVPGRAGNGAVRARRAGLAARSSASRCAASGWARR